MSESWNVQNFLNQLKSAQPQPRSNESQTPQLRKTYLNVPDNLGRYQIFPMISTVTGMPFEYLYKTREVNVVTGQNQDGTVRSSWHKLLPVNAYNFIDNTGRLVSSLTQAESDLLHSAYGIFDKMFELVPESQRKDICRIKNYTVGNAYVINKFGLKDQTKALDGNFSTLLVCTSKDFANAIGKDIDMQSINYGEDQAWLGEIYNRQLENRSGWLIFTITKAANGVGFSVSASHAANLPHTATDGIKISPEDAELMKDPIRTFLGRQAGPEGKLFNEQLIQSTIEEMNRIISKYSNSAVYSNPLAAAQATVATAQAAQPQQAPTMDPMVAAMQQGPTQAQTQSQMMQNNNEPFVNPPAAQFDPMAGVPNNYQAYQQPAFAQQPQPQVGYQQPQFAQQAAPQPENPFLNAAPNAYHQ